MKFQPGAYYVGDPGFVLPNDDLRMLFAQVMRGSLESGPRGLVSSTRFEGDPIGTPPLPTNPGLFTIKMEEGGVLIGDVLGWCLGSGLTAKGRM